jgi:starvation-inducible DNA-binding protein
MEADMEEHYFHWNVEGPNFYEYHTLFDKIVEDVYGSVDPLAEHIRTIGTYAPGSLTRFGELSAIQDELSVPSAAEMIEQLHSDNAIVIDTLSKAFAQAQNNNMQGLMNFLADRIDQHNKWSWFLRASKKKGE